MTCRTQRPASLHSCLVFAHVFDTFHHEKSPVCVWTCGGTSAAPRDAEARPTQRRGRGSRLPRAAAPGRVGLGVAAGRGAAVRARRRRAAWRGRAARACPWRQAGPTACTSKRLSCTVCVRPLTPPGPRTRAARRGPGTERPSTDARGVPGPPWGPHVASRSSYKTVVHTYSISYQG